MPVCFVFVCLVSLLRAVYGYAMYIQFSYFSSTVLIHAWRITMTLLCPLHWGHLLPPRVLPLLASLISPTLSFRQVWTNHWREMNPAPTSLPWWATPWLTTQWQCSSSQWPAIPSSLLLPVDLDLPSSCTPLYLPSLTRSSPTRACVPMSRFPRSPRGIQLVSSSL